MHQKTFIQCQTDAKCLIDPIKNIVIQMAYFFRKRDLSIVRICSNKITESFTISYLLTSKAMCVGSFALFIFDVIAAQITVGL